MCAPVEWVLRGVEAVRFPAQQQAPDVTVSVLLNWWPESLPDDQVLGKESWPVLWGGAGRGEPSALLHNSGGPDSLFVSGKITQPAPGWMKNCNQI